MAQITVAATTAIEGATRTGDPSSHTPTQSRRNDTTQSGRYQIEGQRPNLLYTEDLRYLPMQKDPRYVFYRHEKSKKFDIKN